jgi:uncharacterized protein (TIRG00374 family)
MNGGLDTGRPAPPLVASARARGVAVDRAPGELDAVATDAAPLRHGEPAPAPAPAARSRWRALRARVPAPLRHGFTLFLVLLVVEYFVIPKLVVARRSLYLLERLNIGWLLGGLGFEIASLVAYAVLSRLLLDPADAPSLFTIFRIDLAGNAISHVLPGGTASSAGLGYRLLTAQGVKGKDAGFAIASKGMGSAVVLNILLWGALVVSIPIAGLHSVLEQAALLAGMLAMLLVGALVFFFTRGEEFAARAIRRVVRPIPGLTEERVESLVRQLAQSLRNLGSDRRLLRQAMLWTALNWLLDAASLWAFVAAFGRFVDPVLLFVAYGVANVLAVIPITPGGLGFVEFASIGLLSGFGVPAKVATLGVLGWRLVNFWLPIPAGAAAYVSLRVQRGAGLTARRRALHEMTGQLGPGAGAP